jgi:hypothetical protein
MEARKLSAPSTIFALVNVRQGSLAWQPAVDRLPSILLEDDPATPILCVYLPEETGRDEAAAEDGGAERESILGSAWSADRWAFWKDKLAWPTRTAPSYPLPSSRTENGHSSLRTLWRFPEGAGRAQAGNLLSPCPLSESLQPWCLRAQPPRHPPASARTVKLFHPFGAGGPAPGEHLQPSPALPPRSMDRPAALPLGGRSAQDLKGLLSKSALIAHSENADEAPKPVSAPSGRCRVRSACHGRRPCITVLREVPTEGEARNPVRRARARAAELGVPMVEDPCITVRGSANVVSHPGSKNLAP